MKGMKKPNYFLPTLQLICRNAPLRFLLCIGMLIFIASFPLLNLMALNALMNRLTAVPFQAERLLGPGVAFAASLLLNNAKSLINLLGSYLWITAELALQGALMRKAADRPLIFYHTPEFYEGLQKAKEGYQSAVATTMMLISAVFISLVSVVLMAGYLAQIDSRITAALVLIVFAKSFAFWRETRSLQSLREAQAADIKTRELLSSYLWAKESRIYGASEHFLARWQQLNQRLTEEKGAAERRNLWVAFGFDSLTYLCYGVIMVFAVYDRLGSGAPAAVGGIVVLFAAMDSIFTNINTVVMQFGNLFKNASLSGDLFAFLSAEEVPALPKTFAPEIAVHLTDVDFRYPAAEENALTGINLTVHPKENIAIVGQNGSGKSTLVHLLCCLYQPTGWRLEYGESLQLSPVGYKNIAAMFQQVNTYCVSLIENVCLSETQTDMDEAKAESILTEVMGKPWLAAYPEGGKTKMGKAFGGIELSGGEKQRLSLARTLYRTGNLLFFDEPASALDPLAEDRLYREILNISQDKTTFFITHRMASVRFADRIVVLEGGRIAEEGSFEALMEKNGRFAQMYALQKQGLA